MVSWERQHYRWRGLRRGSGLMDPDVLFEPPLSHKLTANILLFMGRPPALRRMATWQSPYPMFFRYCSTNCHLFTSELLQQQAYLETKVQLLLGGVVECAFAVISIDKAANHLVLWFNISVMTLMSLSHCQALVSWREEWIKCVSVWCGHLETDLLWFFSCETMDMSSWSVISSWFCSSVLYISIGGSCAD